MVTSSPVKRVLVVQVERLVMEQEALNAIFWTLSQVLVHEEDLNSGKDGIELVTIWTSELALGLN